MEHQVTRCVPEEGMGARLTPGGITRKGGCGRAGGGPEPQLPGHVLPLSRSPVAQPGYLDGARRRHVTESTGELARRARAGDPAATRRTPWGWGLEVTWCSLTPWARWD